MASPIKLKGGTYVYISEFIVDKKLESGVVTETFKTGDLVKIRLKNNELYNGIIDKISDHAILLDKSGVYRDSLIWIELEDIYNITVGSYGEEFVYEDFDGTIL